MSAPRIALLGIAVLLLFASARPVRSQPTDTITVSYADDMRQESVAIHSGLSQTLSAVLTRVTVQYANELHRPSLILPPTAFEAILDQISVRVAFQYANAAHGEHLVFPAAFFNDATPPHITGIVATPMGTSTVIFAWVTDEYATSAVLYGTEPGVLPHVLSDPLYTKQHQMTLVGPIPDTLYFRVQGSDRSGNVATSAEHSLLPDIPCYLPLVMRRYL